jgi:hypothetical protein
MKEKTEWVNEEDPDYGTKFRNAEKIAFISGKDQFGTNK